MADFNKIGLLVVRQDKLLLCRKGDFTSKLLLPGGQIEPGESDIDCLLRETAEELGTVRLRNISYIGTYQDIAAADDPAVNMTVQIKLFAADLDGSPSPASEIVEIVWFGPHSDRTHLSPIISDKVIPDLLSRGILPWPGWE